MDNNFSNPLKPYERIIINQRNKIRTLTNELIKKCQKYITTPYKIPNLLKQIAQTEQFDKFTQALGARFVNEVNTWNRMAFAKYLETGYAKNTSLIYKLLIADNELKSFLQKQAEEKAKLFKSIPVELANTLIPKIDKLTVQGATPRTVASELAKDIPSLLEYQVKTIARTETSKISVAITGFKSKKNNIPCYQWKTSGGRQGDGRTRSSHCKMSDVIIFWEDPPAPEDLFPIIGENGQRYKNTLGHYHAGCSPNCRCLASPVIFIDDLKFPVRVYIQGMIKTMTKKDFFALYNAKVRELKAENAQKKQLSQKLEINKSQEELAKEKKAKEEADFLKAQNEKVDKLIIEINSCTQNINALQESLLNCTDEKVVEITEKLNYYVNLIEEHKKELRRIRDSIIISNSPVVGDALVTDAKIIEIYQIIAFELKEKIDGILSKIKENIKQWFNERINEYNRNKEYSYIQESDMLNFEESAGKATLDEIIQITTRNGGQNGYIGTPHSFDINKSLRTSNPDVLSDDDRLTIKTMNKLTTENKCNQDMILDRYVDIRNKEFFLPENFGLFYNEFNAEQIVNEINSNYKGIVFQNNCFVSASYKSKNNFFKGERYFKLRILTPAGTNMYLTKNKAESEVILPLGTKFEVISSKIVHINNIEQIEITVLIVK